MSGALFPPLSQSLGGVNGMMNAQAPIVSLLIVRAQQMKLSLLSPPSVPASADDEISDFSSQRPMAITLLLSST